MKKAWTLLPALVLVLALTACGAPAGTDSGSGAATSQAQSTDETGGGTAVRSGSSADFDFAVTGISRFDMSDGNEGILVDCSVTNKSDEEQIISSITCFSATDTSDNNVGIVSLDDLMNYAAEITQRGKATLDETLAPGDTITGVVFFSAPQGTLLDTVTFTPFFSEEPITLELGGI